MKSKKSKNTKYYIGAGVILGSFFLIWVFVFSAWSPLTTTTTTAKATSTFTLISAVDGEDVSDFVEASVWIPKSTAIFDETEDVYTLTNFQEEKSSMDANDISIDLRSIEFAWLEIDPDGESVFSNHYYLLVGGINYAYSFYVYDPTTDVNFNILDEDTMEAITVSDLIMADGYVAVLDCPHNTTTTAQLHVGVNWNMEQADFDELSATQKAVYYDEKNWAGQYPYYDPVVDTNKDFHSNLEQITDAFCLKFTFNTTISTEDGDDAQVNVTIASGEPVEVIISGEYMFFIWYEGFNFENGAVSLYFDMDTAVTGHVGDIGLDSVSSGRVVVPSEGSNLGTFTQYSVIGA